MTEPRKYPPVWRHELAGGVMYQATSDELSPGQRCVERGHFLPADDARRLVEAHEMATHHKDREAAMIYQDAVEDLIDRLGLELDK